MGYPGGTCSVFTGAFRAKKRTSLYFSREKGERDYIQTRHNDFFSHYNLFLGKLEEKLVRNRIVLMPPGHPIILLKSN